MKLTSDIIRNRIVAEEQGHISAFELPRWWSHVCCWQTDCREWNSKGAWINTSLPVSCVVFCWYSTCLIQLSIFPGCLAT